MNRKNILYFGGIVSVVAIITAFGYAHAQGFFSQEIREKLREAIENRDFASWKETQDSIPRITDYIDSQEKFEKFIEMKNLYRSGKTEEAEAIRKELGLPEGFFGRGPHGPRGNMGFGGNSQEAKTALDNKDYNAWLQAVPEDSPIRKVITDEEKFLKLCEAHEAIEAGDFEKAKEIHEELGLNGPGFMRGFQKGMKFQKMRQSK